LRLKARIEGACFSGNEAPAPTGFRKFTAKAGEAREGPGIFFRPCFLFFQPAAPARHLPGRPIYDKRKLVSKPTGFWGKLNKLNGKYSGLFQNFSF
jgi:hypothetical protein